MSKTGKCQQSALETNKIHGKYGVYPYESDSSKNLKGLSANFSCQSWKNTTCKKSLSMSSVSWLNQRNPGGIMKSQDPHGLFAAQSRGSRHSDLKATDGLQQLPLGYDDNGVMMWYDVVCFAGKKVVHMTILNCLCFSRYLTIPMSWAIVSNHDQSWPICFHRQTDTRWYIQVSSVDFLFFFRRSCPLLSVK